MSTEEIKETLKDGANKHLRDVLLLIVIGLSTWSLTMTVQLSNAQSINQTIQQNYNKRLEYLELSVDKVKFNSYSPKDAIKDNALILSEIRNFQTKLDNIEKTVDDIKRNLQ